ncbi:MAG: hypothetical protein NTX85_03275 [Candidatus Nomurabacteria bacterium]|nr:hypothetical protein [Candidatus Nomurabacteria bacterium]MCX6788448.1 hypothetical protein [Candidatus Jorgensenbacteria bacterium]
MSSYNVQIEGMKELIKAMDEAPSIIKPLLQSAVVASGAIFASKTLKDDPIPWRTGNLLLSFRFTTGDLLAKWYPTAYYAIFVHDGTSRGLKANPFMPKVGEKAKENINSLFRDATRKATQKISGRTSI